LSILILIINYVRFERCYREYVRGLQKIPTGEKFKGIEDINIRDLPVKHPADLVANSPIMQKMALKHSRLLKNKGVT
jgi:hypothetical protein